MQRVHVLVILVGLGAGVRLIGIIAEPARVNAVHVDIGCAMHYPLGKVFSRSRALRNADARATTQPEVAWPGSRAEQRVSVGGVRNRAMYYAALAGVPENLHALHHALDPGRDGVELGREQLILCIPVLLGTGPRLARIAAFVYPDQPRFLLLPVVCRAVRVAHYHHLFIALDELGDGVGDDVLVLHVCEGHVNAGPCSHPVGVATAGIDHMFTDDVALFGENLPFTAGQLVDAGHAVVTNHGGAHVTGGNRHRVATARGVHVSVVQSPRPGQHAGGIHKRVDAPDFIRADDLHPKADVGGDALHQSKVIQFLRCQGEADAAASVPSGVLPSHFL